ncbi:hypothetical protein AB0K51_30835 [Kitasatospora sp. NPDC049285]|uniref:hypothetical protein n=1 Tax=Kitasatospora sp. NPDC049285 TaxID=3157096 RepID=UPI003422B786
MNEEIARRLREAADAHQPDRARILARMERGAAAPAVSRRRPRRLGLSGPKAALAVLAAAGLLATGGFAVAGIVGTPPPAPSTAPAVPSETATPDPTPSAGGGANPAPNPGPSSARPTPSATARTQNGPLVSVGAVDPHSTVYWEQNNLTLKTGQPLSALTVEVRIVQTGSVRDTGNWRTLPNDDFTVTVQESGGVLVYRWVLKAGRTVPAGQHEFAAQFNHAAGTRSAAGDTYRVDARSAGGAAAVWGGFTAG